MPTQRWANIAELFSELITLEPDRRAARLRDACGDDQELHAELSSLLSAHEGSGPLDSPADALELLSSEAGMPEGERVGAVLGTAAGDRVGPYRLLRPLGEGGMGSVWLAERVDGMLTRTVALKLPHWSWILPNLAERMVRERDILAGLEHVNIARLYDAGVDRLGRPYLALEYVDGEPIDHYCAARNPSIAELLRLVLQIAHAVAYAHSRLVVHRDLKPSNVLVTADGSVRLLDFGIAKLLEEQMAPETRLTGIAGRAMTRDYASPEQIRGESIGTASDVYSLGVMTYEMLSGARPYRLKRASAAELEEAIANAEPPAASEVAPNPRRKRLLRGDLDAILGKALKKDPYERYTTMSEFADELERYLNGEPVRAQRAGVWYRTGKFLRRHRWPATLAGGALALILAAAAVALRQAQIAATQRDRAVALAARDEAANDFLNTLITEAAHSDKPVTVDAMLARSEAIAKARLQGNPDQLASVLLMLGANYHTMGQDIRAEPLLSEALSAARGSSDRDLRAVITCERALTIATLDRSEEAKRILQSVIDDPLTGALVSANCLEHRAFLAQNENSAADALRYGKLAWQRLLQAPDASPMQQGEFLGSLGYAAYLEGDNVEANRYYADAMGKFAEQGSETTPAAIAVRNNWAIVSDGAGNPRGALKLYEESLAATRQNGAESAPPPYLLANRARALENLGRYSEARSAYQECAAEAQRVGNQMTTAYCLVGIASSERELGNLTSAMQFLTQAAAVGKSLPVGSPAAMSLKIVRGRIALSENRLEDAHAALTEAIGVNPLPSAPWAAFLNRAEVELAQGALAEAAADAEQALSRAQALQRGITYSNRTGLAWLILGRVKAAAGDHEGARAAFQAAVRHLAETVDETHPGLQMVRRLLATDQPG
jgi:tetratricopeptide (TPR) repeat protein